MSPASPPPFTRNPGCALSVDVGVAMVGIAVGAGVTCCKIIVGVGEIDCCGAVFWSELYATISIKSIKRIMITRLFIPFYFTRIPGKNLF